MKDKLILIGIITLALLVVSVVSLSMLFKAPRKAAVVIDGVCMDAVNPAVSALHGLSFVRALDGVHVRAESGWTVYKGLKCEDLAREKKGGNDAPD